MAIEIPTDEKQEETIHRARTHTPNALEDYIEAHFLDLDDLAIQEIAHHSRWENSHNNQSNASDNGSRGIHEFGQSSGGGNHSVNNNILSQVDEAIAQQYELLENWTADVPLVQVSEDGEIILEASNVDGGSSSTEPPTQVTGQGSVDVDNMSYEQLQSLEEEMGSERRGLSDELISFLKETEFRYGIFSTKGKTEECVICTSPFKRKWLIKLRCQHCYHSRCILRWLKESKACPICKEEVFGC